MLLRISIGLSGAEKQCAFNRYRSRLSSIHFSHV